MSWKREPWEDDLIREHYPEHGTAWETEDPHDGWGYHLADRSPLAIRKRAGTLGVCYLPKAEGIVCPGCGKTKPPEAYRKDKRYANGRNPLCTPCANREARTKRAERYMKGLES